MLLLLLLLKNNIIYSSQPDSRQGIAVIWLLFGKLHSVRQYFVHESIVCGRNRCFFMFLTGRYKSPNSFSSSCYIVSVFCYEYIDRKIIYPDGQSGASSQ